MMLVSLLATFTASPVKLIIDTDIGGGGCKDVDDVVAICVANALVDNGEAELLAVVHNTSPLQCAGAISVLNHYYGHDSVLIGAYKGKDLKPSNPLPYVTDIVDNWPSPIKNSSQVPDGVTVYRKVLAGQPSRSVAISSIGLMTNLKALLESEPDQYSPLNGYDLVAEKVMLLAAMAGKYPASNGNPECNMCGGGGQDHAIGSAASGYVFSHMPPEVKIIFSGFEVGVNVQSGAVLSDCAPKTNPCRQAMIDYEHGEHKSRFSWDPLTTLVAVRGATGANCSECTDCDGINHVDGNTGDNNWVNGSSSNQTYLILHDAKAAGNALDKLLCQPPKNAPSNII